MSHAELFAFLKALESLPVTRAIRQSLYLFPTLESIHVLAIGILFGTIVAVDLRIVGVASTQRPFSRVSRDMLRWTWGAFVVAALTGSLMFTTNARVYWDNTFFRIKMLLILLAGINMLVFELIPGRARSWDLSRRAPPLGVACALISMTLWVFTVASGRLIGFTTTGAAARETPVPALDYSSFLGTDPSAASPAPAASSSPAGPAAPKAEGGSGPSPPKP